MRKRFYNFTFLIFLSCIPHIYSQKLYETEGFASYYAEEFHGKLTSSGEVYDMNKLTCAHPYLPFNTWLKVTNLANNKSVIVRVNDRGPFAKNRIIDLSYAAAKQLGLLGPGTIYVKLEIINPPLTQPEPDIGRVPKETTLPELDGNDVHLRFRTNSTPIQNFNELNEFGLFTTRLEKVSINTGYLIQISSFSSLKNAKVYLDQIDDIPLESIYIYHPSKNIFRVVVGIFSTYREAQLKKDEIDKHYPQCFIITYK